MNGSLKLHPRGTKLKATNSLIDLIASMVTKVSWNELLSLAEIPISKLWSLWFSRVVVAIMTKELVKSHFPVMFH